MTDVADLRVLIAREDADTVIHVWGEVDMWTCQKLRDAIEPHLARGQRVVLDLSRVTFMGSSCLSVLINARTTLTADGGSLIVRNPSDAARRILSLGGLTELLA